MKRLAILGSGDLGQQIAYHAYTDGHYQPIGFFDDSETKNTIKHGLPILGSLDDVLTLFLQDKFDVIMIAFGYRHFSVREDVYNRLQNRIPFGSILHSSSYIDISCKIGQGVFIYPGCTLDMNVEIKDNVVLNVGCVIAHDTTIGEHSFLSPSVRIAGFVQIGQKVNLGIGSIVIDNLSIGNNIRTGAGAVVIKSLETPGLYVGVPATFKKS